MKDFAEVAAPLHALTGKYVRFQWNDKCQVSFDRLTAASTSSPILVLPTDGDVYVLDTDASEQSIGAVLSHKQGGEEKVIAYASRTKSRAEQNYCTTRKELLATLTWLQRATDLMGKQGRWQERLQEFDFAIEHRLGRKHGNEGRVVATAVRAARVLSNNNCDDTARSATNSGSVGRTKRSRRPERLNG